MTTIMRQTTKYFATTQKEAEELLKNVKQEFGSYIKSHTITKKQKKDYEYFIVTITLEYYKDKDLVLAE